MSQAETKLLGGHRSQDKNASKCTSAGKFTAGQRTIGELLLLTTTKKITEKNISQCNL